MADLSVAVEIVGKDLLTPAADSATKSMQGLGSASEAAGTLLPGVAVAAVGMTAALGLAVKGAGDLEQSVANISTIKPDIDTSAVFASLNRLSTQVPQSAKELGDGLYNVFSSVDVSQKDALSLLETFSKGAVGAATDASTFGTSILGVMNAYGLETKDAAHISDVFFNTVNKGVVTGQELAASLGPVTQSAKIAGVSLDELGALIAGVTKEGGPAAQNINNLNNLLQKVTTKEAQKELVGLGVATTDATGAFRPVTEVLGDLKVRLGGMTEAAKANALQAIFPDAQARTGAQTIISQLDFVNEAIKSNRTEVGAAGSAYEKMSATFNSQSTLLGNAVKAAGAAIGAQLLPVLGQLTSGLASLTARFLDLSPETQRWIALGAVVATGLTVITAGGLALIAVLPALVAGFAAAGTIAGVVAAVLTGPVLLAIGAVIAAGVLLYDAWTNNWGGIQEKTAAAWDFLQTNVFTPIAAELARFGAEVLPEAQKAWEGVSAGIQQAWGDLVQILQPAIEAFGLFWDTHQGTILLVATTAWQNLVLMLGAAWEVFQGILLAGLKLLQGDWSGAWDVLTLHLGNAWADIQQIVANELRLLSTALVAAWEGIKSAAAGAWAGIRDTITGIFAGILAPIQAVVNQVMGLIQPITDKITQITSFRPPDLSGALNQINQVTQGAAQAASAAAAAGGIDWGKKNFDDNVAKAAAANIGKRALGGPVTAGTPYLVGEHRPELFIPNQDGYILPNVPARSGGGSAGMPLSVAFDYDRLARITAQLVERVASGMTIVVDGATIGRVARTQDRRYTQSNLSDGIGGIA